MKREWKPNEIDRAWARQQIAGDPVALLQAAGMQPDPWQRMVLESTAPRVILLCSRQSGKSLITATRAIALAESRPNSLVLIGSPSQNQSAELLRKAMTVYNLAGSLVGVEQTSVLRTTLTNGSRLICVPGSQGTVRSYSSVNLIVVDEAAFCEDEFYEAVIPMVAVSKGRIILLSTPHAKQGAFYNIWANAKNFNPEIPAEEQPDTWMKVRVPWTFCPRITPGYIDEYRRDYGDIAYRREFEVEFSESLDSVFNKEEVEKMHQPDTATWALW